jgi:hypothetical protein
MPNDPQYTDPNPGISRSLILDTTLNDAASRNGINQIRGLDSKGSLGSGIPKHVTNVGASVAQAATGTTSTVRVTFHRDPSDKNYSAAGVWVKGYQGNNNPVQVAQSYESPATFVLNNTGEPVSILVQSVGNGGQAPLSSAPTTGITLPKSTVAGYGTGTTVAYTPASPPPTFSLAAGQTGDTLRYNEYGDGAWDACIAVPRFVSIVGEPANASVIAIGSTSAAASTTGTITNVAATSTESFMKRFTGSALASTSVTAQMGWYSSGGINFISLGSVKRLSIRCRLNQTTNCRYYVGWTAFWSSGTVMATNTPNLHYACFRYSAGTDSTIKAVCGTATASQTVVDTLVSVDTTNSQLFDIVYTGSTFLFFINGVQKASISTNTPVAADLLNMQITSDNKNTANAISFDLDYATVVFK